MSHIVIVEDNVENARLASKLLRRAGHEVHICYTGEDGYLYSMQYRPDLILLDLGLPDMDGQTMIPLLRFNEMWGAKPIVAFTAWPGETAHDMVKAYGCDGFIPKPFNTRHFVTTVESFLSSESTGQNNERG